MTKLLVALGLTLLLIIQQASGALLFASKYLPFFFSENGAKEFVRPSLEYIIKSQMHHFIVVPLFIFVAFHLSLVFKKKLLSIQILFLACLLFSCFNIGSTFLFATDLSNETVVLFKTLFYSLFQLSLGAFFIFWFWFFMVDRKTLKN